MTDFSLGICRTCGFVGPHICEDAYCADCGAPRGGDAAHPHAGRCSRPGRYLTADEWLRKDEGDDRETARPAAPPEEPAAEAAAHRSGDAQGMATQPDEEDRGMKDCDICKGTNGEHEPSCIHFKAGATTAGATTSTTSSGKPARATKPKGKPGPKPKTCTLCKKGQIVKGYCNHCGRQAQAEPQARATSPSARPSTLAQMDYVNGLQDRIRQLEKKLEGAEFLLEGVAHGFLTLTQLQAIVEARD